MSCAAKAPTCQEAVPCAEGTSSLASGQDLRLPLQLAGAPVGSPITLGDGGAFTGTFPAPPNGGTYMVRTDYTPTGATAPVASYAANLVVTGGSGGTTPLTLTISFGNGGSGEPPTNLTISLGCAQPHSVPSIYIYTEHSPLACMILEHFLHENTIFCRGVASARSSLAWRHQQDALLGEMHCRVACHQ